MKNIGVIKLHKRGKYPVEGIFYFVWYVYIAASLITKQKRKMKKVLLTAALVAVFGFAANAQTEQGGWLVGASSNLNFTSQDAGGGSVSVFDLDVKGGYFLMDGLAAGLNINYSSFDGESSSAIGIFGRYFVNDAIFAELGYTALSDDAGGLIPITAGYAAFLSDNVAVEPSLNYTLGTGNSDEFSAFGINVGFSLYF